MEVESKGLIGNLISESLEIETNCYELVTQLRQLQLAQLGHQLVLLVTSNWQLATGNWRN